MLLSEWLKAHSVKRKDFAAQIGVSPSYVTALCDRTVWPGHDVAIRIKAQTNGDVTPEDFFMPVNPPPFVDAGDGGDDETERGVA